LSFSLLSCLSFELSQCSLSRPPVLFFLSGFSFYSVALSLSLSLVLFYLSMSLSRSLLSLVLFFLSRSLLTLFLFPSLYISSLQHFSASVLSPFLSRSPSLALSRLLSLSLDLVHSNFLGQCPFSLSSSLSPSLKSSLLRAPSRSNLSFISLFL